MFGPNPDAVHPNENIPSVCYIRNVITRPNIEVGEYTYYDDAATAPFLAKDADKFWKEEYYTAALDALEHADADGIEEYIRAKGLPLGKVMNCLRLALTGSASGLGIADIVSFTGKSEALDRVRYAIERLGA